MPHFSRKAITPQQLDSIIRYVEYAKHPDDRGGWALGHLGPVPEGLVTWLIAAAALVFTCMTIGKRLGGE
jgi:ubiquinol-cytochrome c reductase cytochrome c subunit